MLSAKAKKEIKEWIKSIVSVVALALAIRILIFEPMKIPTGSMEPTLHGIVARCRICGSEYGGNVYTQYDKRCPRDRGRLEVIQTGDRILVVKFIYGPKIPFTRWRLPGLRKPMRGDVLVFKSPLSPRLNYVKRLIATEGEAVEVKNGNVHIDNKLVEDPRIRPQYYYSRGEYGKEGMPVTVPENHIYVLGDNSKESYDSRMWGFVPMDKVVGKAVMIIWPPKRVRVIK